MGPRKSTVRPTAFRIRSGRITGTCGWSQASRGVPVRSVHSVVAFVGHATLKTPMPPNVTTGAGFAHYIDSFSSAVFSESQVERICERIAESAIPETRQARKAHIRQVRDRQHRNARR